MRKLGLMAIAIALSLSTANCDDLLDLLGVKTQEESDFTAASPGGNWEFVAGFEFTKEEVANELFGTSAGLEIPGLGALLDSSPEEITGSLVAAKEVTYNGEKIFQMAFLATISGDTIKVDSPDNFTTATGIGKYALYVNTSAVGYVVGTVEDCDGTVGAGVWAIGTSDDYFGTKTDSQGRYGLPITVSASAGKSTTVILNQGEDCNADASSPVPEPGNTDENPKSADDDNIDPTTTQAEAPNEDDDSVIVDNGQCNGREPGDTGASTCDLTLETNGACWQVVVVDSSNAPTVVEDITDNSGYEAEFNFVTGATGNDRYIDGSSGHLIINTGATTGSNKGVGAGLVLDNSGGSISSVTITYSVASQEFPQYATGSFNDAIGFGFAGSPEPSATDSVGDIQLDDEFVWAWNIAPGDMGSFTNDLAKTIDGNDIAADDFGDLLGAMDLDGIPSLDAASTSFHDGNSRYFGGISSFGDQRGGSSPARTVSVDVPANLADAPQLIFLAVIGDVGDNKFDSALIIHEVSTD